MGGIGGQCPGAPELKGPRKTERKGRKGRKRKENGGVGAPESLLSTGPERTRYATDRTCNFNLITNMMIFLAAAIFKSLLLKMAATVMTVEFGTIHHFSSLEENSEACLCSSLNIYKN